MKLNHFKCPTCGHDWYADGAYGTCDACHTFFYVCRPDYKEHNWPQPIQYGVHQGVSEIGGGYWLNGQWVPFGYRLVVGT